MFCYRLSMPACLQSCKARSSGMSELLACCTMMITARAPLARVAALTASACCVLRNQLAGSPNTESLQGSASLALETFGTSNVRAAIRCRVTHLDRNSTATAGRRCLCLANQSACENISELSNLEDMRLSHGCKSQKTGHLQDVHRRRV